MRLTLTLGMILLAASLMALPAQAATLRFDQGLLSFDASDGSFAYDTCRAVPVGTGMTLPVLSYYFEISPGGRAPDISWEVSDRVLVASVDAVLALGDIVTSDDPLTNAAAYESREAGKLGFAPVLVVDQIKVGETRYAQVLVFPVSVDDDGDCFFNSVITIRVESRPISPAEIYLTIPTDQGVDDISFSGIQLSAEFPVEYLIVTSEALAESAENLATYRNSLGISSRVEVIDDILAIYNGRDDAEKLRERLKQFQAEGGNYVLLAGDETMLPVRYAYPYSTYSQPELNSLQICDLYFADLTGEWDLDGDGVWGERYVDDPDITPELMVARLPFNTAAELDNYVEKLISYETNPGGGEFDYLAKAFFFSSDQMRDYSGGGQHNYIAAAYPGNFEIDTANGVELASGDDPFPYNPSAPQLESVLSEGYGIINVIAHGTNDAFGVKTSRYNEWPKSYFMSYSGSGNHGDLTSLEPNRKVSFYYSLACNNGGFDMDQPPLNLTAPNLAQAVLGVKDAGAVAFVANSRWGWVSSSYLIQEEFFASLFTYPGRVAVRALYDAKAKYSYYTDQVYGLNYFGDPILKVYTEVPLPLEVSAAAQGSNLLVEVTSDGAPLEGCEVLLSQDGTVLDRVSTGSEGRAVITYELQPNSHYRLAAVKTGYVIGYILYDTIVETDVDEVEDVIPDRFTLFQNYPNPFNPSTVIRFDLPRRSDVTLVVYNLLGQVVAVLKDESMPAGTYEVRWEGTDGTGNAVASGIYLYQIRTESFVATRKMALVR